MRDGEVIHLAFRSDTVESTTQEVLSCKTCKNKTWLAIYDAAGDGFPRLQCAACGTHTSYFGWMDDPRGGPHAA